ncbi:MAG: hypothetical protein ACO1SX_10675 [Actinomycetota bacterium]
MNTLLFAPAETRVPASRNWFLTRDGDAQCLALYERHYSCHHYADLRRRTLFVGPGEKLVLIGADADALFVWRKFQSGDGQQGVNCAVFRNEGRARSSELIREAMSVAWERWPAERLYTYVKARAVQSANPGYCFQQAGWSFVRDADGKPLLTRWNRLHILEVTP